MIRFILVAEEAGVYLGSALGMGFWSNWDPVGQTEAVTFDSEAEALNFEHKPSGKDGEPQKVRALPVDIKGTYATVEQCVKAGAPRWNPDD